MTRRGNGDGSRPRQHVNGGWYAHIVVDGKRRTVYGKDARAVRQKIRSIQRAVEDRAPIPSERLTTERFLAGWLAGRTGLRQQTREDYEYKLRVHVLPALGGIPLSKLDFTDLEAFYREKLETLSPTTVRHLHELLHVALRDAYKRRVIVRNPADFVEPPRSADYEPRVLTPAQAQRFLRAAKSEPLGALFVLALTTGMRRGELLGLRWSDIDFERSVLSVRRALYRTKAHGLKLDETKTRRSRRLVPLVPDAVRALQRHRRLQERAGLPVPLHGERDLVFTNSLGKPIDPDNVHDRDYKPFLRRYGLPLIRFQDLRHSAATLLLARNVHPRIVADLLGHSRTAITMDVYSHVVPAMHDEVRRAWAGLLG
jgi:integrase